MILSDVDIIENEGIGIEPFKMTQLQPASYDLTLGPQILTFTAFDFYGPIDPRENTDWTIDQRYELGGPRDVVFALEPGQFVLGHTNEVISIDHHHMGQVEGKSSLGRLGLMVHITAGLIDPGFSGQITLEIYNVNPLPIILFPDMPICQITFSRLSVPSQCKYDPVILGSKYKGQMGATPSRYFMNFEKKDTE